MAAHSTTYPICESAFTPKSTNAKYCSPECRKEAKRKADREFMRKWRAENPEKNAERRKQEDPKARRQRKWRQSPYGAIAYKEAYRRSAPHNPEAAGEIRARRAKAEAEGNATPALIQAKWEASSGTCCLCRESINPNLKSPDAMSMTVEHKAPIARGGRHNIDNTDFAHRVCNSSKGARTTEEYMERRKFTS